MQGKDLNGLSAGERKKDGAVAVKGEIGRWGEMRRQLWPLAVAGGNDRWKRVV